MELRAKETETEGNRDLILIAECLEKIFFLTVEFRQISGDGNSLIEGCPPSTTP